MIGKCSDCSKINPEYGQDCKECEMFLCYDCVLNHFNFGCNGEYR